MSVDPAPRDGLDPQQRDLRISDAERELVVARLRSAVGEGRLTLDEFTDRVDGVLNSRTYGEVGRYVADLPAAPGAPAAPRRELELRASMGPLRRSGRWSVPRRLVVRARLGSVKLDFADATIGCPVVDVDLDVSFGSTLLILPPGASVDADGVEVTGGKVRMRGVESQPTPGSGPHLVVTGAQRFGSLVIRRQYRLWRWRW